MRDKQQPEEGNGAELSPTRRSLWPRSPERLVHPWERPEYLAEHPPANGLLDARSFLTPANIMHRAFYVPLDPRYADVETAVEAVQWSRRTYAIFKRSLDLRRQIASGDKQKMYELHETLDSLRNLLADKADFVHSWHGGDGFLAERRHPYFTLVAVWKAIDRYLVTSYLRECDMVKGVNISRRSRADHQ